MGEKVEEKKLSYDELKNIAGQLQQQNAFMRDQLMKVNSEDMHRYINHLFKVIENKNVFDEGFYGYAVNKLQELLTPQEEEAKE